MPEGEMEGAESRERRAEGIGHRAGKQTTDERKTESSMSFFVYQQEGQGRLQPIHPVKTSEQELDKELMIVD